MIKNRLIPFHWWPTAWQLRGKQYDEQEAYYLYTDYDLAERLAHIHLEGDELSQRLLDLRLEYGLVTEEEYDIEMAQRHSDGVEQQILLITSAVRHGRLSQDEGDKQIADLRGEPWIKVINDGIDLNMGVHGYYFEFDWNDIWIAQLRETGYVGKDDRDIIEQWFRDVCRAEASEAIQNNSGVVF